MTDGLEKIELWREGSQLIMRTPEGQKPVTSTTLIQEIQQFFFIDFGGQQIRPVRNHESKGDVCPHCQSTNTIGHGSRATQTELQIRRWCNNCCRTFVAGKEPPGEKQEKKKDDHEKISFLHLIGFSNQEIAERLGTTLGTVNTYMKGHIFEQAAGTATSPTAKRLKKSKEFETSKVPRDCIGKSYVWEYDGRITVGKKGVIGTVTIRKKDAKEMLDLNPTELQGHLHDLPDIERKIILEYLENKKDDMMGILPKTRTDTKPSEEDGKIDEDMPLPGEEDSSDESN